MLDPRDRPVEVRVEAPEQVDDIVVRFADNHRVFIQAKEQVSAPGKKWSNLWADLESRRSYPAFEEQDRLILRLGEDNNPECADLREACKRAAGATGYGERGG